MSALLKEFNAVRNQASELEQWAFDRSEYAIEALEAQITEGADIAVLESLQVRIGEEKGVQRAILNRVVIPKTGDEVGAAAYALFEDANPSPLPVPEESPGS